MEPRIALTLLTVLALTIGLPLGGAQSGNGTHGEPQADPSDDRRGQGASGPSQNDTEQGNRTEGQGQAAEHRNDPDSDDAQPECARGGACPPAGEYQRDRARYEAEQTQYRNFQDCLSDGEEDCDYEGAETARACARLAERYEQGDVPNDLPAAAQAGRCFALREMSESLDRRRHIDLDLDPDGNAAWSYRVGGVLLADGIWFEAPEDQIVLERTERLPHAITVYYTGAEAEWRSVVRLHDNPTGLASLKAGNGTFFLDLPDNATTEVLAEGQVYRITLEDGTAAHLAGQGIQFDGDLASTSQFMALHRPVDGALPTQVDRPEPVDQQVHQAMERRHLGATISVQKQASTGAGADVVEDQLDAPEVLAYDDVEVRLAAPADVATPDDPLRIEVDAELEEGRTIVIDVEQALFADPQNLQLRYFDVVYQAGRSHEVEVFLVQADSLADAMDPTDDGIQPEYWIVEDAAGIHIMLSVPHWSAHALTVASTIVELIKQPSVAAGMLAGLMGSLIATYGMFRPRRPSE